MICQAITTSFRGPTNGRGSKYIAKAWAGRLISDCDNRLNPDRNSAVAAAKLAAKFGWSGLYVAGGMPDGESRVYVHISDDIAHAPLGIEGEDWFFVGE